MWACDRAGTSPARLQSRFRDLPAWMNGRRAPTFKQLERFAAATRTPFGYFFLPEPPEELVPIADFRTVATQSLHRPSPELLDTIHAMQRRHAWLCEERRAIGADLLEVVGIANLDDDPEAVGREMRRVVGLDKDWAQRVPTWQQAVTELRRSIEALGVVVVSNGVVGNNTRRPLRVEEFRGFALIDPMAALIFVNGADAKSAQIFTMAHELAHVWLGPSAQGLSGLPNLQPGATAIERFCNRAAAEFLVPAADLHQHWPAVRHESERFALLARRFKVSPLVVTLRTLGLRLIDQATFDQFQKDQLERERTRGGSGGDFYNNQNTRVGTGFALQVIRAALEGRIGFREAYALTDLNGGAFQQYARRLGVDLP